MSDRTCSSAPPVTNGTCASATRMRLGCKTEVDDISVLHDVFLAFQSHLAVVATRGHGAAPGQRIVGDDFGTDVSALNVAMDFASRRLRRRTTRDRPRAAFVFTHSKERHVAKQVKIGRAHV